MSASSNNTSRTKLTCPFDLETVFTLQYSTEGLKGVLEWIIDNVGQMDAKMTNKLKQVDMQVLRPTLSLLIKSDNILSSMIGTRMKSTV